MADKSRLSKIFVVVVVVLTVLVLAGLITMVTVYKLQYNRSPPTPRPTIPTTTEAPAPDLRLPRSLRPKLYQLLIQPFFYTKVVEVNGTSPNQTTLFSGNSTVHFLCMENTRSIYLHSRDLTLSNPKVVDQDSGEEVSVSYMTSQDQEPHFLEVRVEETLKEGGNYSLFLAFSGEMSFYQEGLYLSSYVEGTPKFEGDPKTMRYLAATNLEPTAARTLFPCFDEPDMRAEFLVTIVHRQDTNATGNTEVRDSSVVDGWRVTSFHPTPKMSTYLLAFVVSEMNFTSLNSPTFRVKIRTHARPEAVSRGHTRYAESISGNISDFFQEKFGLGYRMATIDQVALPDLAPVAMENWGLITYQETSLLFEEGVSSLLLKEDIAITVAHELAHQWFGNLVSIKWWNELWMKESVATYLSFLAVDHVASSFNMLDVSVASSLMMAFHQDALVSSRPLFLPEDRVQTYNSIAQLYDAITYNKGALLLRMLENHMRPGDFQKGIRDYLHTFQLQSTDHHDLWDSLQKAESTGYISIFEFMQPWINQSGFPVVTINTTSGEVSQKQFLYNHTVESSLLWNVHIDFMSGANVKDHLNMDVRGPVTKVEFRATNGEWILANVDCSGFFRVNYNSENWERLFSQLESDPTRIPLLNRGQIIDDVFNLARAKLVPVTLALNSTRFLRHETEFLPWDSAIQNMQYFVKMFDRSEVYGPLQTYLRHQVKNLYQFFRNHIDNSSVPQDHSQQHSQLLAVEVACSNGLPACVYMASVQYGQWMNTSINRIHSNLRPVVYCQAIAAGGKDEWEFAWNQYLVSREPSERENLLYALSCSRKIWLLNRLLDYTLDPEKIRLTDASSTVYDVSQNAVGHALAWNFLRANWDHIRAWMWEPVVLEVSSRFSTEFELDELERFLRDKVSGSVVEQALEQTRVNIRWVEENRNVLLRWFQQAATEASSWGH